jgi:Rrf2 family protein
MRLTRSVSYAVGILLNIERSRAEGHLTATRIARRTQFPPRFLYRVLRRLVDAELMTGVSGPGGGYALAKPPNKITLLEIVEAVEGPQEATVLDAVAPHHRAAIEMVNALSEKNAAAFRKALRSTTLAQLDRARSKPASARRKSTKKRRKSGR